MTISAAQPAPASPLPGSSPILSARGLHKTYRLGRVDVPVLRGVDLDVKRGEWIAILGSSGSGKSTLLHLLGGLDRPDLPLGKRAKCPQCGYSTRHLAAERCPECGKVWEVKGGSVLYEGLPVHSMSRADINRYRNSTVGFVFQFYHLLSELTIVENVMLAPMIRHGRFGYASKRAGLNIAVQDLLTTLGLSHRLEHRPAELSGGERQRVAIARALMNGPPLLLADEPTGNLDHVTGEKILDMLTQLRKQRGLTIVMVTHDREVAKRADRVIQLTDGRVA
jgi:lipoprotein-releasing system ATP-binding protein